MNKLWHFGSSYAFSGVETVFSEYIAEKYGLSLEHLAVKGSSNYMIFTQLLMNEPKFQRNDMVLINWTYLSRGEYIDKEGGLNSTNFFIYEDKNQIINPFDENELNLDWILNWNYDWNIKLFKHTLPFYFINLKKKGIKIYNVWFSDDKVYQNKIEKSFDIQKTGLTNILDFEPNYYEWLEKKMWVNRKHTLKRAGHYILNIQKDLAEEYIKKINKINDKFI